MGWEDSNLELVILVYNCYLTKKSAKYKYSVHGLEFDSSGHSDLKWYNFNGELEII